MLTNKTGSVLILDDESAIKANLTLFLEEEGFQPYSFSNAENALEAIKSGQTFDVGIIDIRLPGINGEEFILKASKLLPAMKFIIHTGSVDFVLKPSLSEIEITEQDIFKKPVMKISNMVNRIQELIKQG